MSLQGYYLVISVLGWYWWAKGRGQGAGEDMEKRREGEGEIRREGEKEELQVTRLKLKTGIILAVVFVLLFFGMWLILSKLTDSPVPVRDSFITSLSIVATWMLARKIYEHWYLWIVVNFVSAALFLTRGLYPTCYPLSCLWRYVIYRIIGMEKNHKTKTDFNYTIKMNLY